MINQKQIKSLHQKKYREHYNLFIIEGVRSFISAVEANAKIKLIFYTIEFSKKNPWLKKKLYQIPNKIVSIEEIKKLSPVKSPSGILAVCEIPKFNLLDKKKNLIYLDSLSDPGNLGTIIRTATWFGVSQIGYSKKSIDPFNPKVVRSAMGSHFNLSWLGELSLNDIKEYEIIGADHRGKSLEEVQPFNNKWALIMGNESHGISDNIKKAIKHLVSIPKIGEGESLNVGVSMGILLHELTK